MQGIDDEVDAFLCVAGEDSWGDGDSSVISNMLKAISACKQRDDLSPIEEQIKTNPTLCLPTHVLQLAKNRRWHCVLTLVEILLAHPDSVFSGHFQQILHATDEGETLSLGDSDQERRDTCMLLFCKILALQKLKRYGDLKDYLHIFYPLEDNTQYHFKRMKTPSWVPLSLKLYIFCLMYYSLDDAHDRSKKSSSPNNSLQTIDGDLSRQLLQWRDALEPIHGQGPLDSFKSLLVRTRFVWILSDYFIRQNDYRLALKCLDDALIAINDFYEYHRQQVIQPRTAGQLQQRDDDDTTLLLSWLTCRIELVSSQGRILAECGALDSAEALFQQAKEDYETMGRLVPLTKQGIDGGDATENPLTLLGAPDKETTLLLARASYRVAFNNALLHFGRGVYDAAQDEFLQALKIQVALYTNPLVETFSIHCLRPEDYDSYPSDQQNIFLYNHLLSYESVSDLISACCVNISLCALYSDRMRVAIHALESMMRQCPTLFMTECCIFNLCTLYELGYDPLYSEKKKTILWTVAKKLQLDDLADKETFRLS